jgi:hypothetical protein
MQATPMSCSSPCVGPERQRRSSVPLRWVQALLILLLTALSAGWCAGAVAATVASGATPPELSTLGGAAQLQGQGRYRFLGLAIYDIRLWRTDQPVGPAYAEQRFALELIYTRALKGGSIAERSLAEMRRLGPVTPLQAEQWLAAMRAAFPDVQPGDRLIGVARPGEPVQFFHNGRLTGEVADPLFAARFFGIWLAPGTSEPGLRQALLGGGS